jgi:hypothetical protein
VQRLQGQSSISKLSLRKCQMGQGEMHLLKQFMEARCDGDASVVVSSLRELVLESLNHYERNSFVR